MVQFGKAGRGRPSAGCWERRGSCCRTVTDIWYWCISTDTRCTCHQSLPNYDPTLFENKKRQVLYSVSWNDSQSKGNRPQQPSVQLKIGVKDHSSTKELRQVYNL
ncbi:hypothetical protein CEXT_417681 [Caerostris extrusa]|uniref:Uncharacterized protein n=1 Tax=Caerostris extrusa TaxID=172846 RepID=A0AAV4S404_CAEEX|nr:hypothetical protein CEXT_417681 [Caerostris extrusa]